MIWLNTATAARFLGLSARAVEKNAQAGTYTTRWNESPAGGGKNGKALEIWAGSLAPAVQLQVYAELLPVVADERVQPAHPMALDVFSDRDRELAAQRLFAWRVWRRYCQANEGKGTMRELTDDFIELWRASGREPSVSYKSLYRWQAALLEYGPGGLVDGRGGHNRGQTTIPEEALAFFMNLYLDQNKRTMQTCYDLTRAAAVAHGWQLPSFWAFQRKAKELDQHLLVWAREGDKAFDDKCTPYIERQYDLAGNELWVSDHHRLDVHCLHKGELKRPWITAWMDMRSRRFVAVLLTPGPDQNTILSSFAHGAMRHGVPEGVYLDNGKDYKARALFSTDRENFHSLAHRLDLVVHHAIPYNAKAKPIERAFRTFKQQFSTLWKTYCGGKPDEKPERLAGVLKGLKPGDVPTFQQLAAVLDDWIEYWYNERPHQGAGMEGRPPRVVHEETTQVKRTMPEDVARLMFQRTEKPRKIQRQGIWLFERWYAGDKLYELQGKSAFISYDPNDLGRIYVWDESGKYLCDATNRVAMGYHITADDQKAAQHEKRRVKRLTKQRKEAWTAGAPALDPAAIMAAQRQAVEAEGHQPTGPKVVQPIRVANLEAAAREIRAAEESAAALEAVGGTAGAFDQWRRGTTKSVNRSQAMSESRLSDAMRAAVSSIRATKSHGGAEK